tara:strand:+ start:156 stop:440 length:285 start_codon:yes stop_codon:yes gene_type:complete
MFQTLRIIGTGSLALTKPTSKTRSKFLTKSLEEEAKKFARQKRKPASVKELTPRLYLAGQAMSGFLSTGRNAWRMEEIRKASFDWADYMLEDDT